MTTITGTTTRMTRPTATLNSKELEGLARSVRQARKVSDWLETAWRVLVATGLAAVAWPLMSGTDHNADWLLNGQAIVGVVGIVALWIARRRAKAFEKRALGIGDPRLVSAFLESYRVSNAPKRSQGPLLASPPISDSEWALLHLLPMLGAEDAIHLTEDDHRSLSRILIDTRRAELALEIVRAMRQVSGAEAVPALDFIVEATKNSKGAWECVGQEAVMARGEARLRTARAVITAEAEASDMLTTRA